jgi:hypothetical protein
MKGSRLTIALLLCFKRSLSNIYPLDLVGILQSATWTHPLVLTSNNTLSRSLVKASSKAGQLVTIARTVDMAQKWTQLTASINPIVYIADDNAAQHQTAEWVSYMSEALYQRTGIGVDLPCILVSRYVPHLKQLLSRSIHVDQMVYFLQYPDWSLSEAYTVNNVAVDNSLGRFVKVKHFKVSLWTYQPFSQEQSLLNTLINRRMDLKELPLIAMSEAQAPFTVFRPDFKTEADYDSATDTYDVTHLVSGIFPSVLDNLKQSLNFSCTLLKRGDNQWGSFNKATNDSFGGWTGMVRNLLDGSADFVSSSVTITDIRSTIMDFLPPLGSARDAIYTRSSGSSEDLSWGTYAGPFTMELWFVLVAVAFGNATTILFVTKLKEVIFATKLKKVSTTNTSRLVNSLFTILKICFTG